MLHIFHIHFPVDTYFSSYEENVNIIEKKFGAAQKSTETRKVAKKYEKEEMLKMIINYLFYTPKSLPHSPH